MIPLSAATILALVSVWPCMLLLATSIPSGSHMFQPGWPGFVKAKRMGPDDDPPMVVDKRDQFHYGAPARKISVFRVGEKHQEMSFGAGIFDSSQDG